MRHQNIVNRLLYLRNWEFINVFLLPIYLYVILASSGVENWQPYAFSTFIVCFILIQGTFYWHLKLRSVIKNENSLPFYFRQTFSFFNLSNIALLTIYLITAASGKFLFVMDFQASFWANAIFLFAVLEYINYYHYQLSHDSMNDIRYLLRHKKIRRSPLYIDLQRSKK